MDSEPVIKKMQCNKCHRRHVRTSSCPASQPFLSPYNLKEKKERRVSLSECGRACDMMRSIIIDRFITPARCPSLRVHISFIHCNRTLVAAESWGSSWALSHFFFLSRIRSVSVHWQSPDSESEGVHPSWSASRAFIKLVATRSNACTKKPQFVFKKLYYFFHGPGAHTQQVRCFRKGEDI